jgi:uncharacterized protein (TIGR02996 family)
MRLPDCRGEIAIAVDRLPPPRPELIALLDAVKDHPYDDTPRLVLADWLDEQDNELDAEREKFGDRVQLD